MNIKDLFSPLGQQYCDYFYLLSIIFFVFFVLACATVVLKFFGKGSIKLTDALILVTQPLLLYFINRLYYSMCAGSLN
jgi:hypothetical protein